MKKYIHINQHIIRRNKSNGYNEPVITVKTYKSNTYGHSVQIHGPSTVVYSPDLTHNLNNNLNNNLLHDFRA